MVEIALPEPHAPHPELVLEARLPEVSAVCSDAAVALFLDLPLPVRYLAPLPAHQSWFARNHVFAQSTLPCWHLGDPLPNCAVFQALDSKCRVHSPQVRRPLCVGDCERDLRCWAEAFHSGQFLIGHPNLVRAHRRGWPFELAAHDLTVTPSRWRVLRPRLLFGEWLAAAGRPALVPGIRCRATRLQFATSLTLD